MEKTLKITSTDPQRIIIECNGYEIDVTVNEDGILVDINNGEESFDTASKDF